MLSRGRCQGNYAASVKEIMQQHFRRSRALRQDTTVCVDKNGTGGQKKLDYGALWDIIVFT